MNILKKIPFILWFIAALGAIGTIFPGYVLYQSYQSLHWPSTDGLIIKSSIYQTRSESTSGQYQYSYVNEIEYIYKIDGKFLHNDSSNSINGAVVEYPSEVDAIRINKQFTKGKFVKVYYNPDNPSNSVLVPTILYYLYGFIGVFGLLLLIAIFLMFYVSSKNRKPFVDKTVYEFSIRISRDL